MPPRSPLSRVLCAALLGAVLMVAGGANAAPPEGPPPAFGTRIEPLWPEGSHNNPPEGRRPVLEIYAPFSPEHAIAATVVILPGGGYAALSPYERLFAEYFRGLGYTAVVVHYRVAPHRYPAPLVDATRAIRLLRVHAKEWKVPAGRLCLMGGSAGGHLAAMVATQPELARDPDDDLAATVSARPDRVILAYPVISPAYTTPNTRTFDRLIGPDAPADLRRAVAPELHVTAETPPAFLFHAADDPQAPVDGSIAYAKACWAAGVPAELHVFPHGGHGRLFAYASDTSPRWRELLRQWLADWK